VRIQVVPPDAAHHTLERELEERFGLREAIVVSGQGDVQVSQSALGRAAARFLERNVRRGSAVGVSWGTTLRAVIDQLRRRPLRPTVVPLVGGVGQVSPGIHANDLAHAIADAFGGRVQLLHAPAIVASRGVRQALLRDSGIAKVLATARQVELALVGIGGLVPSSTLVQSGFFSADDLAALRRRGAVGDVCTRPFASDGSPVDGDLDRRILAIDLPDLRRITTVVAVAGGAAKAEAIRGALVGRLVDVLVTDHLAAREILKKGRPRSGVRAARSRHEGRQ
jgi:DNA-binding transcriptional regulator LsrR (DeoR family)